MTRSFADPTDRRRFLKAVPKKLITSLRSIAENGWWDGLQGNAGPRIAHVDVATCHAWSGFLCQQCYLACPKRDEAIEMRDQKPVIVPSICDGCAMCVSACETVSDLPAIRIASQVSTSNKMTAKKEVTP